MTQTITITTSEAEILRYVLGNVIRDLEWDDNTEDYRDCGGIIAVFDKDEYDTLVNLKKKIRL